jgi:hypothetical protein
LPSQVIPATHLPVDASHRWPAAHSASVEQVFAHVVPLQT